MFDPSSWATLVGSLELFVHLHCTTGHNAKDTSWATSSYIAYEPFWSRSVLPTVRASFDPSFDLRALKALRARFGSSMTRGFA